MGQPTMPWVFQGAKFIRGLIKYSGSTEGRADIQSVPRSSVLDARLNSFFRSAKEIGSTDKSVDKVQATIAILL